MNNEKILKKAIEKAKKNGWGNAFEREFGKYWDLDCEEAPYYLRAFSDGLQNLRYEAIIFSHDFAKAVGYKLKDLGAWCDEGKKPLKYLEKYL